jgi:hypothetical protein
MNCKTVIRLVAGESFKLTSSVTSLDALGNRVLRDLTGARLEFRSSAFIKKSANNGGSDLQILAAAGSITVFVLAFDTALLAEQSYPFVLWITWPDSERHALDRGMINVTLPDPGNEPTP